ncbi:permease [Tepidibacter thalassicus]|uniref:Predicted permease n=1 Tax=Tepidibacter thalassicus DSM 15285 TaxID=1123350 RepID=A0A1M5NXA3_9FIRM|nr:permease [Tepidibacter thalassicus]SHG94118.1 Predicted permease [Tepidibacter thalassicus DSM 15285]
MTTILLFLGTIIALGISLYKNKEKTLDTIKKARGMMGSMISDIVGVLLIIGLILSIIPPEKIESLIGSGSGFIATIGAAFVGTITLIPAFVAFPLIGSLRENGAGIMTLTAFLTTLTMVGFVTFPIESRTFGKNFAIKRNVLSFIFALIIALIVGVVM